MGTTLISDHDRALDVKVYHIDTLQPLTWLTLGWRDLRRGGRVSLAYGALIVAIGWTLLVFGATHPYFVAAAVTGFLLVGPAVSAGLCEISRRYAAGRGASFDDSLEGYTGNAHALGQFGAVLAAGAVMWFGLSALLLGTVVRVALPSIGETLYRGFIDTTTGAQWLVYVAVGGVLAAVVFAVSVVTIPVIIDRHASAGEAMQASLRAVLANVPAMIVWSALILVLTIIGYASLLLGLLVIAPLLGHATWHAYRDLIR